MYNEYIIKSCMEKISTADQGQLKLAQCLVMFFKKNDVTWQ